MTGRRRVATVLLACAVIVAAASAGPLRARATNPRVRPCEMSAGALRDAAERGLRYLVHAQHADGSFVYLYEARTGRDAGDYNIPRHEGSALVLAEGSRRLANPEFGRAAARALDWLERVTVADPIRGGTRVREDDAPGEIRLGTLGLGAVAWLAAGEAGAVDPARARAAAEGFGREILAMQRPSGQLAAIVPVAGGDDPARRVLDFHPGEGTLALARLSRATGEQLWFDAAVRSASFEVSLRRDAPAGRPDAWLPRAIADLFEQSPDPRWPEAGRVLGRKLRAASPALPGTALGEANAAWARLARAANEPAAEDEAFVAALTSACIARGRQIDPSRASALPDPVASLGGIPGDDEKLTIRIDTVQHAVGLWLVLAAFEDGTH